MSNKRTAAEIFEEELNKKPKPEVVKKHTLDSDEEDSGDDERSATIIHIIFPLSIVYLFFALIATT